MTTSDFSITLLVDQTPQEVFDAVNNVRGWWIDEIEGESLRLHDEFSVRFFVDVHYSKQRITECIPGKKVTWLVIESRLNFLKDKSEWTGTSIHFDISKQGNQTQLRFTHEGLVPKIECYGDCSSAWSDYISNSLFHLITTGKGQPTRMKETSH